MISLSLKKADEIAVELQNRLGLLPVDHLARETGFVKRKPRKIQPIHFLLGFFLTVLTEGKSLGSQATHTGLVGGYKVSKQAIHKRLGRAVVLKFVEWLLAASLSDTIKRTSPLPCPEVLSGFNRVLVEDSTCIQLPASLAKLFPGSRNATGKANATLKIRATTDVLRENFVHFALGAFTQNDQSASGKIVELLQPGDLVIRDLGFFVLSTCADIEVASAYFINRLKYGIKIYEPDGTKPINLLRKLRKSGSLDIDVCVGAKEKLPCRLVAIPLAQEEAAARRRKYKANRDRRLNPSREHLALLGWEIFITNVPREKLTAQQIAQVYELRWRIEIIFKSWKSHFNLTNVPKANATRVQAYVYAMLIFITLFHVHIFVKLYRENLEKNGTQLSLLKVAKFFKENLWALILTLLHDETFKEQIFYHCKYESRKDRLNYAQKVLALG